MGSLRSLRHPDKCLNPPIIRVLNRHGAEIFLTYLRGEKLRHYYEKEIGLTPGYSSLVLHMGTLSVSGLSEDIKLVIEIAARQPQYLDGAVNIKPFQVRQSENYTTVVFAELDFIKRP
jgi:hypothetical protein